MINQRIKLSEAYDKYIRIKLLGAGRGEGSENQMRLQLKRAIKCFGDVQVRRLTVEDVSYFYPWLRRTRAVSTSRETVRGFRAVLRFCNDLGVKTVNPDQIIVPKPEKKMARFLSKEEVERFAETAGAPRKGCSPMNRMKSELIIRMLFATGLRIGELCALNRDSIRNRQFSVVGKSKYPRPCYITKEIEQRIKEYLNERTDDSNALFVSERSKERIKPDDVERDFRRISKLAGVGRVHPHALRHSFGTLLIENGVDIRFVAELLGHENLSTTQRYTHIRDSRLRSEYEKVMELTNTKPDCVVNSK